jgi:hypothetical protein
MRETIAWFVLDRRRSVQRHEVVRHAQQCGVLIRRAVFFDDEDQNRGSAFGQRVDPRDERSRQA